MATMDSYYKVLMEKVLISEVLQRAGIGWEPAAEKWGSSFLNCAAEIGVGCDVCLRYRA